MFPVNILRLRPARILASLLLLFVGISCIGVNAETEQEWVRLSSDLVKSGKLDEALVKVNLGLKQFPESESLSYGRAMLEYSSKNYDAAAKHFDELFKRKPKNPEYMTMSLSLSHVAGNVPPKESFSSILKRDLQSYFKQRVEYELLRDAPTQAGVSYPHYYAWVRKYEGNKLAGQGAVRVDAVSRKSFTVTDYIDREEIIADPERIERIFPAALCSLIRERSTTKTPPK
jgi:tetratricopeptide (TPR) repeat protein